MTVTQIGQSSGTINAAGDSDWFKVTLTAGTSYVFDVGGGTLQSGQVSLYDSSGNLVTTGNSAFPGATAETSFTVGATGTYYIAASGPSGTGTYNVLLSSTHFDYAGNTTTAGTLAVGTPSSGTLVAAGQNDWYKISLNSGTQYVFTAGGGAPADVQVTVYDANGNAVTNSNLGGTVSGQTAVYEPTAGGTYYVGVSATTGGTGAFTLSASTASFNYASNTSTTGTIAAGGSVSSTISTGGQSEWFKISLTAGTNYTFNVGGGTLTPGVEVYDANGNMVAQGYNGGTGGGAATSFEPTSSGTYYVAASSFLSSTGTYTLSVGTSAVDFSNNTNTTGSLTTGHSVTGTLGSVGQSDWFKVSLTAGSEYVFDVVGGTLASPEVALYDSNGKQIATATAGHAGGGAQLVYEPTASGTFYVVASGQPSLSTTGSYTVSMSSASYTYLGNTQTAGTVAIGASSSSTITTAGQSEWFKVSLASTGNYVFDVKPGTMSDAQISLYSSTGALISTGGTELSLSQPASGTYFIGVSGSNEGTGTFTVSAGTYTDDYSATSSTTGIIYSDLTAAAAIAQYNASTLTQPIIVLDSAADVQGSIDGLQAIANAGFLHGVSLTDSGTPTLTITATQFANDTKVLADIMGSYSLDITGVSVAQAATVATAANVAGITVSDTGANIGAGIDGLQNLVNAGQLTSITVSDGALIPVTQVQMLNDATALNEVTGNYRLSVTGLDVVTATSDAGLAHVGQVSIIDVASNISAFADTLQGIAAAGKLGTVAVNDSTYDPLNVTAAQMSSDATALGKVSGNFYFAIDGSVANITVAGIAGHGNILDMSGLASQYSVTPAGDGTNFTLTDVTTGRTSTDHLSGINAIQFSDFLDIVATTPGGANALTTGNITELYGAAFGRTPDVPGLAFYQAFLKANPNVQLQQYAQFFLASPEYTSNPAHNYAQTTAGDQQFVTDSYQNLLHRTPAASEVSFYETNVLAPAVAGLTAGTQAYTNAQFQAHALVMTYFSQSPEFLKDVQVTSTTPADATHWLILV